MALSAAALKALLGRESADGIVLLATITAGSTVLRFANNSAAVTSNGNVFTAFPFDLALAADGEAAPRIEIRIANVDRKITDTLMGLVEPPTFKIEATLLSSPNTIERGFDKFVLRGFTADALVVEAELTQERLSSEPWPRYRAIPSLTPLLFE